MILPIVAYGDPVLRKETAELTKDHPGLTELVDNMFETMYRSSGVGLAAPQIGMAVRLFIIDTSPMIEDGEDFEGEEIISEAFINPKIIEKSGEPWSFAEGCLSIPGIREDIIREETVKIKWVNQSFEEKEAEFSGFAARVIMHEYDHIEGKLFTDYLKPLKKRLLKKRLDKISKGEVEVKYRMRFPVKR